MDINAVLEENKQLKLLVEELQKKLKKIPKKFWKKY